MVVRHITIGSAKNCFSYDDGAVPVAMDLPGPVRAAAATADGHLVRKQEADVDYASGGALIAHIGNTANPHGVTLTQAAGLTGTPVSGTFTTGSAVPGAIASLTFENGILVGVTTVP